MGSILFVISNSCGMQPHDLESSDACHYIISVISGVLVILLLEWKPHKFPASYVGAQEVMYGNHAIMNTELCKTYPS